MSDKWVKNRLNKAVGKEQAEEIKQFLNSSDERYKVRKDLFHMDEGGNITIKELDKDAKIKKRLKEIKNGKGYL
ncbi:hypothetical protein [Helicobacter japonicus]|uniref:Uncharacterized protein n=1 Tax=Helicobacter japonicus TaxID=425400 RepID=A0A4U8TKP9_9HELI|nr:hypothetical protein [Helicobacter japonicus]MDE7235374.1 hypothetical protein [Helicobacter japonicus]TLE00992.1 hypothetical protein LS65_006695 [Helicobacter japonicus]